MNADNDSTRRIRAALEEQIRRVVQQLATRHPSAVIFGEATMRLRDADFKEHLFFACAAFHARGANL